MRNELLCASGFLISNKCSNAHPFLPTVRLPFFIIFSIVFHWFAHHLYVASGRYIFQTNNSTGDLFFRINLLHWANLHFGRFWELAFCSKQESFCSARRVHEHFGGGTAPWLEAISVGIQVLHLTANMEAIWMGLYILPIQWSGVLLTRKNLCFVLPCLFWYMLIGRLGWSWLPSIP